MAAVLKHSGAYPKNVDGGEYYMFNNQNKPDFVMHDGELQYARDKAGNEMYPMVNGQAVVIETISGPKYAKSVTKKEIYPKDVQGNEIPWKTADGQIVYAKDESGNEMYPKDRNQNERFLGHYAKTQLGTPVYPLNAQHVPQYQKDLLTGDEIYHVDPVLGLVIAKDKWGDEVYAKRANGDEFYPPPSVHARWKDGIPKYAVTKDGHPILPKDLKWSEYYLEDDIGNSVIVVKGKMLPRYAKHFNGHEIYPVSITNKFEKTSREITMNNQYAMSATHEAVYPLDEFQNEYTLKLISNGLLNEKASFPSSYPITNDNVVIVPSILNKPYFLNNSIVQKEDIVGKLYRERVGFKDFLTKVTLQRQSRGTPAKYRYLPNGSNIEVEVIPLKLQGRRKSISSSNVGVNQIPLQLQGSRKTNTTTTSLNKTTWSMLIIYLILFSICISVLLFALLPNNNNET